MTYILYIVALTYLLLPLQFALSPFPGIDLAIVRICIIFITILFFIISLLKQNLFMPRGWTAAFFTAFFMWTFFSLFFSPVPLWTARKIIFFITLFPLFYILTTLFAKEKRSISLIVKSIVYGSTVISVISIFQFALQFITPLDTLVKLWGHFTPFFLGQTFSESVIMHNSWLVHVGSHDLMRAIAFFPDPHVFSFYLGITIPLSLSLFFSTKNKVWLCFFLIIITADILTFSRGGYVGLVIGSLAGILLYWRKISTRIKHGLILLAISCVFLAILPQNPVTQRFTSSFSSADTSVTHRIELWQEAFHEIQKRPFIGTGLGAYSQTVNPLADYRTPIYVHNLFLDILVELGFIGLFFFVGIMFSTIFTFLKNRSDIIPNFAIISMSIFFAHSVFDTALFSVHVIPLILFIFALSSYYENNSHK